ncbi:MAG: glycosyl hydrolase [Edaphobacter sp.]|uniref:WD40/YVTN/BNR-like repeat-containing protein n=1 Tax=Edaphobacter sp. TaxID=1934404 RepID=UPI002981103B|nr:glycosyl hydrolase [Edaphobacter sp.]MDW5264976.1 glycosyl hydrolase [Edaphobacter sp.]
MRLAILILILTLTSQAKAQWDIEDSHTTASLRGIDSIGDGVAWASGTNGTVLRTQDDGSHWQACTIPPGADKLDFRGIQVFDANTAIVMSSGKGDLSRIYKTTDGCQTWKLVFTNPDADGFFDSVNRVTTKQLYLLGDPVDGKFSMYFSSDAGATWFGTDDPGLDADKGDGAFAASNSSFTSKAIFLFFGTGGGSAAHVYYSYSKCGASGNCPMAWAKSEVPIAAGSPASGVFSLALRATMNLSGKVQTALVAIGGVHDKPQLSDRTAATSSDGGTTWLLAQTMPGGYRSAVVFDSATQTWITVGPNGTDISRDDGRNWKPLKPTKEDAPDADKNWNALSLPFVVGPNGRIGKLRPTALNP